MTDRRVAGRATGWILAATVILAGAAATGANVALAGDEVELATTLKDHKFDPAEIKVPAGKAVKLTVTNKDDDVEEFDSSSLRVEKLIGPNDSAVVRIQPLAKGTYPFMGEYHEETAKGAVVAE